MRYKYEEFLKGNAPDGEGRYLGEILEKDNEWLGRGVYFFFYKLKKSR